MQERQLYGVPNLLDLSTETADVLVSDVRNLLENEILHLGLGNALERVAGLGVDQQRIPGTELP